jgi:hypothetical protein
MRGRNSPFNEERNSPAFEGSILQVIMREYIVYPPQG